MKGKYINFLAIPLAFLLANPAGGDELPVAAAEEQSIAVSAAEDGQIQPVAAQLQSMPGHTPEQANGGADKSDMVVTARASSRADPLARWNAKSFAITQAVDQAVIRPAAMAFKHTIPEPIRSGLRNWLGNVNEPVVFLHYLLQIKPGKAAETLGRFVINSTAGVGGIFDIAKRKPFRLPRRPNGLANTLGYYGVKTGMFLYLPLVGSTTIRDFIGNLGDRLFLPLVVGRPFNSPFYSLPSSVAGQLDKRAENDEAQLALREDALDDYVATRDFYLRRRQAEIDNLRARRPAPPVPGQPANGGEPFRQSNGNRPTQLYR